MTTRQDIRQAAQHLRGLQLEEHRLREASQKAREGANRGALLEAMFRQRCEAHAAAKATAAALGEPFDEAEPEGPPPGTAAAALAACTGLQERVANNQRMQEVARGRLLALRAQLAADMYADFGRQYAVAAQACIEALAACAALGDLIRQPVNVMRTYLPAVQGHAASMNTSGGLCDGLSLAALEGTGPSTIAGRLQQFEALFLQLQKPEPAPDAADLAPVPSMSMNVPVPPMYVPRGAMQAWAGNERGESQSSPIMSGA